MRNKKYIATTKIFLEILSTYEIFTTMLEKVSYNGEISTQTVCENAIE